MVRSLIVALIMFSLTAQASTQIYPVSAGVKETLKEIGESSKVLETRFSEAMQKTSATRKLMQESKCSGAGQFEDSGCKSMMKDLKKSTAEMINVISEEIPALNEKVKKSVSLMKANINKYSKERSFNDFWKEINNEQKIKKFDARNARGGLSKMVNGILAVLDKFQGKSPLKSGLATYDEMSYVSEGLDAIEERLPRLSEGLVEELTYGNFDDFSVELEKSLGLIYGDQSQTLHDDIELTDESNTKQNGADTAWITVDRD